MAIINSYPTVTPSGDDLVLIIDTSVEGNPTKTATASSISSISGDLNGTPTQIAFFDTTKSVISSNNLYWDNVNSRLGVNTNTPVDSLHVEGGIVITGNTTFSSTITAGGATGTAGQVLSSTGTGVEWVDNTAAGTVTGSGTTNVLPVWTDGPNSIIGDSGITDDGTNINIQANSNLYLEASALIKTSTEFIFQNNIRTEQGNGNTSIGNNALNVNAAVGSFNTAYGESALEVASSSSKTVAIGSNCMALQTAGTNNTGIGHASLKNSDGGSRNTAVGNESLVNATVGEANTAIGHQALYAKLGSNFNTAVGANSLPEITTGFRNTAIGYRAGQSNYTGQNNTSLGQESQPSNTSASNEVTLGNSSISVLRCAVTTITSLSDERDKTSIEELPYGIDFVNSLQPKKFIWDNRAEIDSEGNEYFSSNKGKKDIGFIAQELQAVDDDWLDLVYDSNPERLEASYGRLIPVLVKAIQELSAEITALKQN